MTQDRTNYATVHVTTDVHERIRQTSLNLTVPSGRRVTISDVVRHALEVAWNHPDEFIASLRGDGEHNRAA